MDLGARDPASQGHPISNIDRPAKERDVYELANVRKLILAARDVGSFLLAGGATLVLRNLICRRSRRGVDQGSNWLPALFSNGTLVIQNSTFGNNNAT
jgi:hypothetical protein